MSTINVSAARAELPRLIEAVERGEEIVLTRHGKPVAVLVSPDREGDRRSGDLFVDAEEIAELFATGRGVSIPVEAGLSIERADELVAKIHADRSSR